MRQEEFVHKLNDCGNQFAFVNGRNGLRGDEEQNMTGVGAKQPLDFSPLGASSGRFEALTIIQINHEIRFDCA